MYGSWRELVDGYAKSLWASFGSAAGAAAVTALLLALYVLPIATLSVAGLAAYALGVGGRIVTARATGARALPQALAHPVSIVLFAWLVAVSFRRRRQGRLAWKGRSIEEPA
jgi:hypothetical protein